MEEASKYLIQQSLKTRILNFFRTFLTIPWIEKLIVSRTSRSESLFWNKVYPMDYLYRQGSIRNVERGGIRFSLDISHVVDNYLYYRTRDTTFDSISESIQKARVIFDIGANIGSTAMLFAKMNSSALIYAFEPHPRTLARAEKNLSLNSFENVRLQGIGLGERTEVLRLYEVNSNNPGMNRIFKEQREYPSVAINISTIDEFALKNAISSVEFIKIDVEGFEFSVLKGGEKTLTQHRPILFIELDDENLKENGHTACELVGLLNSFGYSDIYRANTLERLSKSSDFSNCHYDIIAQ